MPVRRKPSGALGCYNALTRRKQMSAMLAAYVDVDFDGQQMNLHRRRKS